jgi:hypothetical protein
LYPGAVYPDNQKGIVFQPTAGSIGGVVYLPYCSPFGIELGPTDIPGGWDGKGAGDVSSLTASSTGRTSTFRNVSMTLRQPSVEFKLGFSECFSVN